MRIPGRKFLRRTLRPLAKRLAPGAVVLGYHRVADAVWDPLGLAVSPRHFRAQVETLKEIREVVSLGRLAGLHAAAEPLHRYAALTFDDGYDDFAQTVLPVIEVLAVPATVFVATGFTGRSFWWDEIAALLTPTEGMDTEFTIALDGDAARHYESLGDTEKRAEAARDICNRLACASDVEIRRVIDQLRARVPAAPGSAFGAMSRAELEAVARHPLAEIGAHTVSHGCLGRLDESGQRAEIERSKSSIEALPGVSATVFSYPNGSYSATTPGLVRGLGFTCACTSREGVFKRRTDPYRVPRVWTPDVAAPGFRQWLGNWVAGVQ
jgi:peptidoglycan/xylan/chitin deacetylase (PgdA/CDA1 family)